MLLLEDKRSGTDKIRSRLIQEGFIRFSPDKLEVYIELRAIALEYGTRNVKHCNKLMKEILFYFDHELDYSVEQSYALSGTGYVVSTMLRKREQKREDFV